MIDTSLHHGLVELPGQKTPVWVSAGLEDRAGPIAERTSQAADFLSDLLGHPADFALLLLRPADWDGRADHPAYGMPNSRSGNLILAGEPSTFWAALADLICEDSPQRADELAEMYADAGGGIDLAPFFDLLAVHELTHIYEIGGGLAPPRLWLREFACNLCLHAYVAEQEPQELDTLTTLPRLLAAAADGRFPFYSLADFENRCSLDMEAMNYAWYQARLHLAAETVYGAGGPEVATRLWRTVAELRRPVSDADLADLLEHEVHPELAKVLHDWPR